MREPNDLVVVFATEDCIALIDEPTGLRSGAASAEFTVAVPLIVVIRVPVEFSVVLISRVFNFERSSTLDTFRHARMLPVARLPTFHVGG